MMQEFPGERNLIVLSIDRLTHHAKKKLCYFFYPYFFLEIIKKTVSKNSEEWFLFGYFFVSLVINKLRFQKGEKKRNFNLNSTLFSFSLCKAKINNNFLQHSHENIFSSFSSDVGSSFLFYRDFSLQ